MQNMLPRYNSFYGRVTIYLLVVFSFIIYSMVQQTWYENELRMEFANDSPLYELSIHKDLQKQLTTFGFGGEETRLQGIQKKYGDMSYNRMFLNVELSDRISYNRHLRDNRHEKCLAQTFSMAKLPSASVIIIFHNEPYSVLLRTIHSTLNTCDARVLKEIILVDDGSTVPELDGKLDYYIRSRLPNEKIEVIRLIRRMGIPQARLAGARVAVGDVLIFLDAHCEANVGWCEPLLQHIKSFPTTVALPVIDAIDSYTFKYVPQKYDDLVVGGFDWSGEFNWINMTASEKRRRLKECPEPLAICPVRSPTMSGGLFAIGREYFWKIGSYDPKMQGWGGENLEMSFRIWQCGGSIEVIPCARVGHVFRKYRPYNYSNNQDTHALNTARMAMVWLDDYINLLLMNRPELKSHFDFNDVLERIKLRRRLNCRSFDWYLHNIYPEKFLPTKNAVGFGRIRVAFFNLCLDNSRIDTTEKNIRSYSLVIAACGDELHKSQLFTYTKSKVLRTELTCAAVPHQTAPNKLVKMLPCFDDDAYNEKWNYVNMNLIHQQTNLCLDHRDLLKEELMVMPCKEFSDRQRWIIEYDWDNQEDYYH